MSVIVIEAGHNESIVCGHSYPQFENELKNSNVNTEAG